LLLTMGSTAAVMAGPAPVAAVRPSTSAIEDLGHYAEDAYDQAKVADWTKGKASVAALKAAAGRLGPAERKDAALAGQLDRAVTALDKAVSGRDQAAAMREANRLTRVDAELSRPSRPTVPADVTLLDYYGRELEIWASAGDLTKLRSTVVAMGTTWRGLRPQVLARGGSKVASRFDGLVKQAESAPRLDTLAHLATPILDEVDQLENAFTGN
jgi:hypothetical protein